jgi:hypothetical protein
MFYIMREAGYSVHREQSWARVAHSSTRDSRGRVMDLVAADPRGVSQVLADVVVADPTSYHGCCGGCRCAHYLSRNEAGADLRGCPPEAPRALA